MSPSTPDVRSSACTDPVRGWQAAHGPKPVVAGPPQAVQVGAGAGGRPSARDRQPQTLPQVRTWVVAGRNSAPQTTHLRVGTAGRSGNRIE